MKPFKVYIPNPIDERKSFLIMLCQSCGEPLNKNMIECPSCLEDVDWTADEVVIN